MHLVGPLNCIGARSGAGSTTPSMPAPQHLPASASSDRVSFTVLLAPSSTQDWASRRVGFAKADHSQDGEVEGAIDSPEAKTVMKACQQSLLNPVWRRDRSLQGPPLSRKGSQPTIDYSGA